MPRLKNTRHEAFAQACAVGMSASDAYRTTYGTNSKNADVLGSRLSLLVKVGSRIAEIQTSAEHVTHLTIATKRSIYAREFLDKRNALRDRLKASQLDSEIAGHIKHAASTPAMNVTVNVVSLTEERRVQLMQKKREAAEWQITQRNKLATHADGNGSNGKH